MQQLFATFALGGLAALDATPVAQTMLSQPLVTAALLGLAWGDMHTALEVGIILQLFASSTQPVGARTPEDYALGGVVGTGIALALSAGASIEFSRQSAELVGVFAGMAASTIGMPFTRWQRRRNESLSRWCEDALRRGDEGALGRAHGAAVALAFGIGVALTAVCVGAGYLMFRGVVQHDSLMLARAWRLAQPLLIGIGLAFVLNGFVQRRIMRAALFGLAMVGTWLYLMLGGA